MVHDLMLRRKLVFRAHNRQMIFVKRSNEHTTHVLLKAFLWALYLPTYTDLQVEVTIGDRFKPDVVSPGSPSPSQQPRFWGEAGQVSAAKLRSLARRYRTTHFALARWDASLDALVALVQEAIAGQPRHAPFDVLVFPPDSAERFIDAQGMIDLTHADVLWHRL